MRRREFIAGLGSAAMWPQVARAQQGSADRGAHRRSRCDPTGIAYVSAERRDGEPILETG